MKFDNLVSVIVQTHRHFQQQAVKAVNISLTIRNWLIGFYITEFELKGEDRAKYGDKLFDILALRFRALKGIDRRSLYRFTEFYKHYPQIKTYISTRFSEFLMYDSTPIKTLQNNENQHIEIVGSITPQSVDKPLLPPDKILYNLSYTHFEQLLTIEDPLKRNYYEIAAIKGTWSVRELKKQINSLAYERVGLSKNIKSANKLLLNKTSPELPEHAIKSVYTFDFLGINSISLLEEKDLETALLNHLQDFIKELGLGFCFEDRQKRILIDDEYFFADLVFYHRFLKCHVIIELKIDAFKHEYLSQLNTYVSYYNAEIKREDDNPAIGILLCTEKGKKLVEYATAGMDQQLFVSKYLLKLPRKEVLESFIQKEINEYKAN